MALTKSLGGAGGGITQLTGDVTAGPGTGSQAATIPAASLGVSKLSATGTPSATTYLRGDNTWATPSGGSTVATPGTIADLVFWFESDDVVGTSGYPVPSLRNRTPAYAGAPAYNTGSGSGATVASTTLNSLPVLNFAGANAGRYTQLPTLSGVFSAGATIFVVFNPNSFGAISSIIAGAGGSLQLAIVTTGKLQLVRTNIAIIGSDTTTLSTGTWYQANATYLPSSGAYAFRVNRAAGASGTNIQSVSAQNNAIAYNSANGGEDLNAKIAAIIAYSRVLTNTEITNVENYINTKWGV